MKYIFIVGGVVSGLGKGIVSSSIGLLLKASGFKVNHIKIDPYLNIDPDHLTRIRFLSSLLRQVYNKTPSEEGVLNLK